MENSFAISSGGSDLQRRGFALTVERNLRPGHGGRLRIDDSDVEVSRKRGGDKREKQEQNLGSQTILLCTRKGY
jgi:hypothetical protein